MHLGERLGPRQHARGHAGGACVVLADVHVRDSVFRGLRDICELLNRRDRLREHHHAAAAAGRRPCLAMPPFYVLLQAPGREAAASVGARDVPPGAAGLPLAAIAGYDILSKPEYTNVVRLRGQGHAQ